MLEYLGLIIVSLYFINKMMIYSKKKQIISFKFFNIFAAALANSLSVFEFLFERNSQYRN